jgi:hypothetical protein
MLHAPDLCTGVLMLSAVMALLGYCEHFLTVKTLSDESLGVAIRADIALTLPGIASACGKSHLMFLTCKATVNVTSPDAFESLRDVM